MRGEMAGRFVNWAGNQACTPARRVSPRSEAEVVEAVRAAAQAGEGVRVVAAGHSFTPVCLTDGTLLDLANLQGILAVDPARRRVTALPGTTIGAFGEPLWERGLALANQGDIDTQGIAGAIGTATHGSGIRLQSLSAALRRCRLVTGTGEVLEIDESRPDLLHAAQVSVGMLGVMTELELEVVPAYRLAERIEHRTYHEVVDQLEERVERHRHFSLFWCPAEESAALYGLGLEPGKPAADACYVKVYDEAPPDLPDDPTPRRRVDRSYRIYPMAFEPNFHELEYFVPYERAREALGAMRELMLASQPDAVFPLEVRTVAADAAYLSPQHGTATLVLSVSGRPGTDYWGYLRSVDRLLGEDFGARVHWGKLHFLTPEQLYERYPEAERFVELRRQLDPAGVFLNDHLRALFA
jgi:FAD/FMN-containing dehydrogenase